MLYLLLKWLHVLSAIVAVGTNVTYGFWIARASASPDALSFALRTIKQIDGRLANPAYGLLLVTGLGMAFTGSWALTTPWLLTALILYATVALVGVLGFAPLLRRRIQLLESEGIDSPAYRAQARRGAILGIVAVVLVVIIVFLMVVKPGLWG